MPGPRVDAEAAEDLQQRFRGDVLLPGHAAYDEARAVWNGMIDRWPAVIARCAAVADVSEAVDFARDHGLVVTVRGGGHGVAGNALADGGLVIDLSLLRSVTVDPERGTARADGGCTLGDLDRETQAFGLAVPLGVVSETGIAGLTLSGGIGWLRRKHGLASDNLVSVDVVTADGRLVSASEAENADLFWALRGGGGSFGAVTSFEYRAHPVGPEVMVCFVLYPGELAADVLRACDEYTAGAPDEVGPLAFLGRVPHADAFPPESHGKPYVAVAAVYAGEPDEGERVVAALRALAEPIVDLSGISTYREAQALLDEDYPAGWRYYWKSADLDVLGDDVLGVIAARADVAPSPHSTIDVWFHGGELGRIDPAGTAFGKRPAYLVGVEANWEAAGDDDTNVAWARETVAALEPFGSGGGYLNFPGLFEEGEEQLRAAYGDENYERLVTVKNRVDPGNVFGPAGAIRSTV
jgi:FAD/FMN-containing dehydrogenase